MSTLLDTPVTTLHGKSTTLRDLAQPSGPVLLVNVASKCGLTPQYKALEQLAKDYGPKGLTVVGVPCNQFGGQEPGSAEEIQTFCSTTYGVTFPLLEKAEVNGEGQHPLYRELTQKADADGQAGAVQWNFEKFLIAPDGSVSARFRPTTAPQAPELTAAIEALLPGA
jgi:glutathione peroxidase